MSCLLLKYSRIPTHKPLAHIVQGTLQEVDHLEFKSLTGSVTLGKLLGLSGLQLPHL